MLPRPTSHSKALGPGVAGPELAVATSAVLDAPPRPSPQQPLSGAENFMVDPVALSDAAGPRQHTQYPYVTGTSVLAIKYKDGVMVACDTLGAYGSTKRYKSIERIKRINDHVVLAASGEISDFQYILKLLDELTTGACVSAWAGGVWCGGWQAASSSRKLLSSSAPPERVRHVQHARFHPCSMHSPVARASCRAV